MLHAPTFDKKNTKNLAKYGDVHVKQYQYSKDKYLQCLLDETMSGES